MASAEVLCRPQDLHSWCLSVQTSQSLIACGPACQRVCFRCGRKQIVELAGSAPGLDLD